MLAGTPYLTPRMRRAPLPSTGLPGAAVKWARAVQVEIGKEAATRLRPFRLAQRSDLVARWGGEEFILRSVQIRCSVRHRADLNIWS